MKKSVMIYPDKCTGCRICEMICSFGSFEGHIFNPYEARIRIEKIEELGVDLPILCLHCHHPLCVEACPNGAITITTEGYVKIDYSLCNSCNACVIACPYGAIRIVNNEISKCNLCGGDPLCIKWCPTQAITFELLGPSEIIKNRELIQSTKTFIRSYSPKNSKN